MISLLVVIREIYYPRHVCANDRLTIHPFSKQNKRVVTEKHHRFTDFQGKSIQDIQSLFNANPTRYFKHYTRVSLVRRALRDTLLGANSPCWTLTIASIPHQTYQQRQKATTTGTKRHAPIVLIQRHKHSAKKQKIITKPSGLQRQPQRTPPTKTNPPHSQYRLRNNAFVRFFD